MIELERNALQALPQHKTMDYTDIAVKVSSSSTINVRTSLYTVPSRLIAHTLRVRLYHDRLECFLGSNSVITLERVYGSKQKRRARQVDYRHVIHSLIKKPQAFRGSQLRDDLLPSTIYQKIWAHVDSNMPAKQACKFIVGILYLAASEDCEDELGWSVMKTITEGRELKLPDFQNKYRSFSFAQPVIDVRQHSIVDYNQLIPNCSEVAYV